MNQLPPTQRAVLFQASTGKSNAEIADALGLAITTVRQHKWVAKKTLGADAYRRAIYAAYRADSATPNQDQEFYVPVVDGIRQFHLGLYLTRKAALAQVVGRLGDAEKVWIATERK